MDTSDNWRDRDSGPVVRPYAVTGGRTEPANGEILDLTTVVVAVRGTAAATGGVGLGPEHRAILSLCRRPVTVADLASETALPPGVVRVLLADLLVQGRVRVLPNRPEGEQPSVETLREVLHGLRAL